MTPNRPDRSALAAAALLLAVLIVASACGSSRGGRTAAGATPKLRRVDVMLDWTPNTNHSGMYLARAEGWYRAAGLDVHFIEPGSNDDVLQVVASGRAQFGISASEQLVPARAQGVPVVSLAAIIQHNTSSLMALKSSGVTTLADLSGKKYGAFGEDFEKALVARMVACGGGRRGSVKFVDVGNVDYRVGLEKHFYDFVWVFDGWDVIRLRDIDKLPITTLPFIAHTGCIPDWYTPVLATSEHLVKSDPALVRSFMAATARGYRASITHPADAAAALTKAVPELDPKLVGLSATYLAQHYAADPAAWGQQDPAVWNRFVAFLESSKLVKPGFDTAAAYTNAFLPSAAASGSSTGS
ncbi:MAG TPA: ABC transporter substrate-binding protein [Acidimicrobiales bacterium]